MATNSRTRNDVFHLKPSYLGRVLAYLTGNITIVTGVSTLVTFNTTKYDDLGAWNSTNNTRLVVPAGVRYVRLHAQAKCSQATTAGDWNVSGSINYYPDPYTTTPGSYQVSAQGDIQGTGTVYKPILTMITPPIDVVERVSFGLILTQNSGGDGTVFSTSTWMCMEALD